MTTSTSDRPANTGGVEVTEQYLRGELSLLLGQLQTEIATSALSAKVTELRHRAESGRRSALGSATRSALELADRACWSSLSAGDIARFVRQASLSAQLRDFGVCSGLIVER